VAHATQNLSLILLNLHSAAASVTELPSRQLVVDYCSIDWQPSGQAFYDCDQRAPM
jgi:hypothetical protein